VVNDKRADADRFPPADRAAVVLGLQQGVVVVQRQAIAFNGLRDAGLAVPVSADGDIYPPVRQVVREAVVLVHEPFGAG
jgi:hypothetical protein